MSSEPTPDQVGSNPHLWLWSSGHPGELFHCSPCFQGNPDQRLSRIHNNGDCEIRLARFHNAFQHWDMIKKKEGTPTACGIGGCTSKQNASLHGPPLTHPRTPPSSHPAITPNQTVGNRPTTYSATHTTQIAPSPNPKPQCRE